ncbi:hypothetical protein BDV25DRAFT_153072 [Aspergillus avenaceus]|uniref:Uncharacterized protein n=1 Tax=Aspergillus avenaceus TaxID=36643 RepID=A0A5N6TYR6_ASPAV|nr:hypothetical protein BDV25DRAFT_153072 [Aspergillus avenaceus]
MRVPRFFLANPLFFCFLFTFNYGFFIVYALLGINITGRSGLVGDLVSGVFTLSGKEMDVCAGL